jgi:hypothetical protein
MKRLFVLAAASFLAILAASVQPARACSCAPIDDPRRALLLADGAFVGRLLEKRPVRGSDLRSIYVFRVETAVKGRFADTVEVESATDGAACGLEVSPGASVGLLLDRRSGRWTSSLCSQVAPARLRDAGRPLPRPDGRGPIVLLAAGSFGKYRTLALDARGRTLAYGGGGGIAEEVSVCPGSGRAVEVVAQGARTMLAVRELRTFRVVRTLRLRQSFRYGSVVCRDRAGNDVLLYGNHQDLDGEDVVLRLRRGGARTVWRGRAVAANLERSRAFVCAGRYAGVRRVLAIGLGGRVRHVARVPRSTGPLTPGPDGRFLAGVAAPVRRFATVVLVDVPNRRVRTATLRNHPGGGTAAWLGRRRFVVIPSFFASELRTFGVPLNPLGVVRRWRAETSTLVGGRVVGVDPAGVLVAARPPRGQARALRTLPTAAVHALAHVRGRVTLARRAR